MRKRNLAIIGLVMAILFMNCNKDDNDAPPDTPSVIDIDAPTAGTIFINGTGMEIRGNVADDNALSSVKVEVRNSTTGAVMYQQNNATGNVLFHNFLWNWTVVGINTTTNATVKIIATDRYNYQVSKEVAVVLVD
jgi:hypothetical protein